MGFLITLWVIFAYFVVGLIFLKVYGLVAHKHPNDFFCDGWRRPEYADAYRCPTYDTINECHKWTPGGAFAWMLIWPGLALPIFAWSICIFPIRLLISLFSLSATFLSR